MARTRKSAPPKRGQVIITGRDDDDDDETGAEEETQAQAVAAPPSSGDEVEQMMEQLGASASAARIIVHRVTANADPEECIDCPLSVFSKEQLRAQFGPGRYSCEVRHKGVIRRRWEWRFAQPLQMAAPAPGAAVNDQVAALQRQIAENTDRERQRTHDLMVALIGRPQRETAPGLQLGDLAAMKELFGGNGGGSTLGQFKEFLELRELMGGDDKGSTGMDLALKALDVFPQWLAAGQKQLPAPRERKAAAPGTPAIASGKRDQLAAFILQHAKQGTAPQLAAQFIFEQLQQLDDKTYDTACSIAESEGAVNMALMIEPRLAPARDWLEQVASELRPLISADQDDDGLTGSGAPGEPAGGDSQTG